MNIWAAIEFILKFNFDNQLFKKKAPRINLFLIRHIVTWSKTVHIANQITR